MERHASKLHEKIRIQNDFYHQKLQEKSKALCLPTFVLKSAEFLNFDQRKTFYLVSLLLMASFVDTQSVVLKKQGCLEDKLIDSVPTIVHRSSNSSSIGQSSCPTNVPILAQVDRTNCMHAYVPCFDSYEASSKRVAKPKRAPELPETAKELVYSLEGLKALKDKQKSDPQAFLKWRDFIPEYSMPNTLTTFYETVSFKNGGSSHLIFKAQLRQNRLQVNKGTEVALRVYSTKREKQDLWYSNNVWAYLHLSTLRERQITEFIPEIYGIYLTKDTEVFEHTYFEKGRYALVTEMEYLNGGNYENVYLGKKTMSPRVAFEHLIGNWALYKVVGCSITDADGDVLRHYMVTHDSNYAAYHLGTKIYLFEPGYSARQVDFDDFVLWKSSPERTFEQTADYYKNYLDPWIQNDSIKKFLAQISQKGIVISAEDNLKEFEVSESNPLPASHVKHFYLPDEMLVNQV
jgi:hypothetical protein